MLMTGGLVCFPLVNVVAVVFDTAQCFKIPNWLSWLQHLIQFNSWFSIPTFFVLPKEASGIPEARNTWGEAWLQKRCSETEAGEQANRRQVQRCAMCKVRTKWQNQLQNQPRTVLGSSRAQDLTAGHWARSYKAGVKPFFFGQNTKITIGIFEIFIRYIIDVILRYTIADDTLITLRKDFTSETDLHLKQLLTEVRYTSDDD